MSKAPPEKGEVVQLRRLEATTGDFRPEVDPDNPEIALSDMMSNAAAVLDPSTVVVLGFVRDGLASADYAEGAFTMMTLPSSRGAQVHLAATLAVDMAIGYMTQTGVTHRDGEPMVVRNADETPNSDE